MKVLIDARAVESKLHGVSRHILNVLLGLSYIESELEFLVLYGNALAPKVIDRSGGQYRNRFQWIKSTKKVGGIVEKIELPWLIKVNNVDLFHDIASTGFRPAGVPTLTTFHELEFLHFSKEEKLKAKIKRSLKNTKLMITVSQALADEIESHFHISMPKIRVIPNAIDPWYGERVPQEEIKAMRERFKLSSGYFLSVTADRPSKNHKLVLKAAETWNGPEQWAITVPGKSDPKIKYIDVVEDVWLRALYAESTGVIVPSLYEGFSLPPIEALATGTIPVVSDIPPHREFLEDILPKELFFDPGSYESLERSLQVLKEGRDTLKMTILEKFANVRERYSFLETAKQIESVYKEALA